MASKRAELGYYYRHIIYLWEGIMVETRFTLPNQVISTIIRLAWKNSSNLDIEARQVKYYKIKMIFKELHSNLKINYETEFPVVNYELILGGKSVLIARWIERRRKYFFY